MSASHTQMRLRREDTSPSPEAASASEFSSDSWSEVGAGDDVSTTEDDDLMRDAFTGDLGEEAVVEAVHPGLLSIYNDDEIDEGQRIESKPGIHVPGWQEGVGELHNRLGEKDNAKLGSFAPSQGYNAERSTHAKTRDEDHIENIFDYIPRKETVHTTPSIEYQLGALRASLAANQNLLMKNLSSQAAQIANLQNQIVRMQDSQPYPLKPGSGISPEKVTELATSLATGEMDAFQAAEQMFQWIEKCNARPSFNEGRDALEPMVRIGNLEGVLDVTLGRVGRLEKEVEGMKSEMREDAGTVMGEESLRESSVLSERMDEDKKSDPLADWEYEKKKRARDFQYALDKVKARRKVKRAEKAL